jgi:hypothetical protein
MSEGIRILCENCQKEFQVDEKCTEVHVQCPICKHAAPSGINLRYEIGAPQPQPSGELVKRATWFSSKVFGDRRQRDLILSTRKSKLVLSFFAAAAEGKHPTLVWERTLSSSVDPDAEFRREYNKLRCETQSAGSVATAHAGTEVKTTEPDQNVKATEPGMPDEVRKQNQRAGLIRYSVDGD